MALPKNRPKAKISPWGDTIRVLMVAIVTVIVIIQKRPVLIGLGVAAFLYSVIWGILVHTVIDYEKNRWLNFIPVVFDTPLIFLCGYIVGGINTVALIMLVHSVSISATQTSVPRGFVQVLFGMVLYTLLSIGLLLDIIPYMNILGPIREFTLGEFLFGWAIFALNLFSIQGVINNYSRTNKRLQIQLSAENEKSNSLLLNILPESIAADLKDSGETEPRLFDSATIVFIDFCGFTESTRGRDAASIVDALDVYFSEFDEVMDRHGTEKLKTIGDGYMFAAGLPESSPAHAADACGAALEILEKTRNLSENRRTEKKLSWNVKIGIASGPVAAGIIGERKFHYDVWGETVNMASRLESAAQQGTALVSATTYLAVKDHFDFSREIAIELKGFGSSSCRNLLSPQ